ncbi:integrase core domain-containing protein [Arthrobacter sp. LAPM80]|uniref:integrase core domain-containing protein n=1 Tax=Arthrobacter sp. LAPM80 TaxID=3141788 RepID=UPI00398A8A6E
MGVQPAAGRQDWFRRNLPRFQGDHADQRPCRENPPRKARNERSQQSLRRFLDAQQSATLEQFQGRINRFRDHYNNRRPLQSVHHATPRTAWDLLEHTPTTQPIPL